MREPARVLTDVMNGIVSPEQAREEYLVAIDPAGSCVDPDATSKLRAGEPVHAN
jgi:N-methylhydantoinase B/oxoprolinase/acetone carboxylase alpha subunit